MKRYLLSLLALLLLAAPALAQPTGTITANPKAVKLRRIWMVRGSVLGGEEVGRTVGGLGDLFGDGNGVWGVDFGKLAQLRIYKGSADSLSTVPIKTFDSVTFIGSSPVVGDFWGDGHKTLGFSHRILEGPTGLPHYWLYLHQVDSASIADTARLVWSSWTTIDSNAMLFPPRIFATNLDNDSADELIVVSQAHIRLGVIGDQGEIWIFRGGADFQVDSPTVIIRDIALNSNAYYVTTARVDADEFPDLVVGARHGEFTPNDHWQIMLYRNIGHAPWFSEVPDHIFETGLGSATPDPRLSLTDVNGDGLADFAGSAYQGDSAGVYLWLSGTGRDPFTRAFTRADADLWYAGQGITPTRDLEPGYLNDSNHRYQMHAAFTGGSQYERLRMILFSGAPNGSNGSYVAHYSGSEDGMIDASVFQNGAQLGDVSGDGWDDYLCANDFWYRGAGSNPNPGIALILAGGPYIPRDSTMLHVREVAVAGRPAGLFVWPNPVVQELNIAWRGDLKQMPRHFEVHDMLGRNIASGSVDPGQGAALWQCGDIPAGVYLLSVYDGNHQPIATTHIIKQE